MGNFLPGTLKEITRARYKLVQRRPCKRCGDIVEHWTTTHGIDIYFNAMVNDNDEAVKHSATCKALVKQREEEHRAGQAIHKFAASQQAAIVIVLDRSLNADWSLANDCYSEPLDIHNAITAAADQITKHIESRFAEQGGK